MTGSTLLYIELDDADAVALGHLVQATGLSRAEVGRRLLTAALHARRGALDVDLSPPPDRVPPPDPAA